MADLKATTKTLVNQKVSLKRLAALHTNINTLIERALADPTRIDDFEALCTTYLKLVHQLAQIELLERVTLL
jgi:hypothetical protein